MPIYDGYGVVILSDSTSSHAYDHVASIVGPIGVSCIATDPPYGNIVNQAWDKTSLTDVQFANWMLDWTRLYEPLLQERGAMYVWGGIGKPGFRPFYKYIPLVEENTSLRLSNHITWAKKRAYGVQNNYLFTREECAFFIKGDPKKPAIFNVPYLEEKRPYAGFNKDYPAKSEHYRRTNVWSDITEIFRGKEHECQKPDALMKVIVSTSSNEGDWVLDPFSGSGSLATACIALKRKFIVIENDQSSYDLTCRRIELALT